jgi:histone chaperone ASF1
MSIVTIRDVTFLNNPARFSDEYKFRVTFECISPLKDDLEWKLIFVSSPDSEQYDQELDDCMVGPVPVGINSFTFSSPPPDPSLIPPADVLGVAAIILTASYRDQEFVRVGYYQNTEYDAEELRQAVREAQERGITNSPILWDRLVRELADKPRVTRFTIKWFAFSPHLFFSSILACLELTRLKPSSAGTRKNQQHPYPSLGHHFSRRRIHHSLGSHHRRSLPRMSTTMPRI